MLADEDWALPKSGIIGIAKFNNCKAIAGGNWVALSPSSFE